MYDCCSINSTTQEKYRLKNKASSLTLLTFFSIILTLIFGGIEGYAGNWIGTIALKNLNGGFVAAVSNCGWRNLGRLQADRGAIGSLEKFQLYSANDNGDRQVFLQSCDNLRWVARPPWSNELCLFGSQYDCGGDRGLFYMDLLSDYSVIFKVTSDFGQCAQADGRDRKRIIRANTWNNGTWETYFLFQLNKAARISETHLYINENSTGYIGNIAKDQFTNSTIDSNGYLFQSYTDGRVFVNTPLDYESQNVYSRTARGEDYRMPVFKAEGVVYIHVVDVPEPPTLYLGSVNTINENTTEIVVANLDASDPDRNDSLTYYLIGADSQNFRIDKTGPGHQAKLVVKNPLNYEAKNTYSFTVRVTDSTNNSNDKPIIVRVNDVPEPPTVYLASVNTINENTTEIVVANLDASDPDINDSLTYYLIDADSQNFRIDKTGPGHKAKLVVKNPLNYEAKNTYSFTVRVTDSTNKSNEKPITVRVNDVPEPPTVYLASVNTINENTTEIVVANLDASDPDSGDSMTYYLIGADSLNFRIDKTGPGHQAKLVVKNPLNYEAKNTYSFTVRVTDSTNKSNDKPITVRVNDVPEPPTVYLASVNTINENTTEIVVANLDASDPDINDSLTYYLIDADSQNFRIDKTGPGHKAKLVVKNPLNYEAKNTYSFTVRVTDSTNNSNDKPIIVRVNDVKEAPVITMSDLIGITENTAPFGEIMAKVNIVDEDNGDSFVYVLSGEDREYFLLEQVDKNNMNILLKKVTAVGFDFEADKNKYNITVTATDKGGLTASRNIVIKVIDVIEPIIEGTYWPQNSQKSVIFMPKQKLSKIKEIIYPEGASNKNEIWEITQGSQKIKILRDLNGNPIRDSEGNITIQALSEGVAYVKVTTEDGGHSETFKVIVTPNGSDVG